MARKNPEIAEKGRKLYTEWRDYFRKNINQYHKFFPFVMGRQWDDDEARLLNTYKKQPLVFNKLGTLINSRLGEQLQNTPQLEVQPDSTCDVQTAAIRQALIKSISLNSDAVSVYQQASEQALIGGYGAYLIDTEYENESTFNQRLVLKEINDPTKCFWDKGAKTPCKTDGMCAGYEERMSRKKFKSIYGAKVEKSIKNITSSSYDYSFADDDGISIIYWYEREYAPGTLYKLSNGVELSDDDIDSLQEMETEEGGKYFIYEGMPVQVEEKRKTNKYKINHYATAGEYVLEESEFPSQQLPLVFMDQHSYYDKKGEQICKPFILDAYDAQRYINYIGTQSCYMLKISRYDQYMVSKNNVKSADTAETWSDPTSVNGALIYDVDVTGGTRPEQLRPPELSQSLLTQYERAMNDIHTSTGMYQTQLGDKGNEVSRVAIDARARQGSYATNVSDDARNKAIAVGGQIINEAIPYVYDTERVLMLMMPDTGMTPVMINQAVDEYGMQIQNDMIKGTYQVRLMPGPSSEGQKSEARESLQMVMQANPEMFTLIADLYAESLPLQNNIELRNRLRTIVPPQVIEAGKSGKPVQPQQQGPSPEQQAMAMQQQQMQMQVQLEQQQMQLKAKELELKEKEAVMKMQIELKKIEEERLKIAAQLEEQQLRYDAEMHRTRTDQNISHANNIMEILTHLGDTKQAKQE